MANDKVHASPNATYESCSTAIHKHGRTETLRSATSETRRFVETLRKGNASASELRELVNACSNKHNQLTKEAAMGQGWDRHLFALKLYAQKEYGTNMPAIFTDPGYLKANEIILSTSTLSSPAYAAGGFAAPHHDGYGVGYRISNDLCGMALTTWKTSKYSKGKQFITAFEDSVKELGSEYTAIVTGRLKKAPKLKNSGKLGKFFNSNWREYYGLVYKSTKNDDDVNFTLYKDQSCKNEKSPSYDDMNIWVAHLTKVLKMDIVQEEMTPMKNPLPMDRPMQESAPDVRVGDSSLQSRESTAMKHRSSPVPFTGASTLLPYTSNSPSMCPNRLPSRFVSENAVDEDYLKLSAPHRYVNLNEEGENISSQPQLPPRSCEPMNGSRYQNINSPDNEEYFSISNTERQQMVESGLPPMGADDGNHVYFKIWEKDSMPIPVEASEKSVPNILPQTTQNMIMQPTQVYRRSQVLSGGPFVNQAASSATTRSSRNPNQLVGPFDVPEELPTRSTEANRYSISSSSESESTSTSSNLNRQVNTLDQPSSMTNYLDVSQLDFQSSYQIASNSTSVAAQSMPVLLRNQCAVPPTLCDSPSRVSASSSVAQVSLSQAAQAWTEQGHTIEYKEIDPVSTQALATIRHQFIDDSVAQNV